MSLMRGVGHQVLRKSVPLQVLALHSSSWLFRFFPKIGEFAPDPMKIDLLSQHLGETNAFGTELESGGIQVVFPPRFASAAAKRRGTN